MSTNHTGGIRTKGSQPKQAFIYPTFQENCPVQIVDFTCPKFRQIRQNFIIIEMVKEATTGTTISQWESLSRETLHPKLHELLVGIQIYFGQDILL